MLLLFVFIVNLSLPQPKRSVEVQPTATVVILQGQLISAETWNPKKNHAQREILWSDLGGPATLLRLTEFE